MAEQWRFVDKQQRGYNALSSFAERSVSIFFFFFFSSSAFEETLTIKGNTAHWYLSIFHFFESLFPFTSCGHSLFVVRGVFVAFVRSPLSFSFYTGCFCSWSSYRFLLPSQMDISRSTRPLRSLSKLVPAPSSLIWVSHLNILFFCEHTEYING